MPTRLVIGIKATSIDEVSEALKSATGRDFEQRESWYVGEYNLFRSPDRIEVKYNFVPFEDEWDYPEHKEYEVLIVADPTERPDHVRALVAGIGYEGRTLEESEWRLAP